MPSHESPPSEQANQHARSKTGPPACGQESPEKAPHPTAKQQADENIHDLGPSKLGRLYPENQCCQEKQCSGPDAPSTNHCERNLLHGTSCG